MRKGKVLMSKDGEVLHGFQEVDPGHEEHEDGAFEPTRRCKRCGCWLREARHDGDAYREYCSPCLMQLRRQIKVCALCAEAFFSEDTEATRCPECEEEYQAGKKTCRVCGEEFLPYTCVACKDRAVKNTVCHACHWESTHAQAAARKEHVCRICGCRFLPRRCIVPECRAWLGDVCTVCHEEEYHMGMTATVWTLAECPKCEQVIDALRARHRHVTRMSIEKLVSGEERDIEAMAQWAYCGGVAPLVFLDGRFLESEEIDALIDSEEST